MAQHRRPWPERGGTARPAERRKARWHARRALEARPEEAMRTVVACRSRREQRRAARHGGAATGRDAEHVAAGGARGRKWTWSARAEERGRAVSFCTWRGRGEAEAGGLTDVAGVRGGEAR